MSCFFVIFLEYCVKQLISANISFHFAENFTEMAFPDGDGLPVVHEVSPFVTLK